MIRTALILLFCVANIHASIILKTDELKNKWLLLDSLTYEQVEDFLDYHEALRLARTVEEYDKAIKEQDKVFAITAKVICVISAVACFTRNDVLGFLGGAGSMWLMSYEF